MGVCNCSLFCCTLLYVPGDKNSMGWYVRGDKNSMGCFVRGGKSLWDVLSVVSKNGMGCFVPGCFVRLPFHARKEEQDQKDFGELVRLSFCRGHY